MNRELSEVAKQKPPSSDKGQKRLWIIPLHETADGYAEIMGKASFACGKKQEEALEKARKYRLNGTKQAANLLK